VEARVAAVEGTQQQKVSQHKTTAAAAAEQALAVSPWRRLELSDSHIQALMGFCYDLLQLVLAMVGGMT